MNYWGKDRIRQKQKPEYFLNCVRDYEINVESFSSFPAPEIDASEVKIQKLAMFSGYLMSLHARLSDVESLKLTREVFMNLDQANLMGTFQGFVMLLRAHLHNHKEILFEYVDPIVMFEILLDLPQFQGTWDLIPLFFRYGKTYLGDLFDLLFEVAESVMVIAEEEFYASVQYDIFVREKTDQFLANFHTGFVLSPLYFEQYEPKIMKFLYPYILRGFNVIRNEKQEIDIIRILEIHEYILPFLFQHTLEKAPDSEIEIDFINSVFFMCISIILDVKENVGPRKKNAQDKEGQGEPGKQNSLDAVRKRNLRGKNAQLIALKILNKPKAGFSRIDDLMDNANEYLRLLLNITQKYMNDIISCNIIDITIKLIKDLGEYLDTSVLEEWFNDPRGPLKPHQTMMAKRLATEKNIPYNFSNLGKQKIMQYDKKRLWERNPDTPVVIHDEPPDEDSEFRRSISSNYIDPSQLEY